MIRRIFINYRRDDSPGTAGRIVRRQNISDIRFGKLREYLAHLV
jgi:hypothetical protein